MITLAQLPMLVCHLRQIADDGVRSHGDAWAHGVRFAADQMEGGEVYTVPPAPSDPVGQDRMAIKLLVAAGFVTEEKANESLRIAHGFGGDLGQPAPAAVPVDALLASDHSGMRVDYSGLIRQTRGALTRGERDPALAEMQRQLAGHLEQLGKRWYAGDTSVVDELLQLYCIEPIARAGLKTTHPLPAAARSPCACHDHADAVCSEHQPAGEVQP
ncbi:hypothetical protein [Xanthomonas arboricola]|uniref:hypothetical protein n=1 Tax=Xanthomonas arboricola TaxID=56448 RepID=UPI003EB6C61C